MALDCTTEHCPFVASALYTKLVPGDWDGSVSDWTARYLPPVAACGLHGKTLTRNGWQQIWEWTNNN